MTVQISVTQICKSMDRFPRLDNFLRDIVDNNLMVTTQVHESFKYHSEIIDNKLYGVYGIFIDYFIRRIICEFRKENFYDPRVNSLKNPEEYYEDDEVEQLKQDKFAMDLNIIDKVENIENDTFDILEDLTIYSSYHFITFLEVKLDRPFNYYDLDYLQCIKRHIAKSFNFEEPILTNPDLGCDYFSADCDLIYSDFIIVIRNSKFRRVKTDFYQLLLYAFGYYKKSGILVKKFKFYSTLLGLEAVMILREDMDVIEFERILIIELYKKMEFRVFDDELTDEEKASEIKELKSDIQCRLEDLNLFVFANFFKTL